MQSASIIYFNKSTVLVKKYKGIEPLHIHTFSPSKLFLNYFNSTTIMSNLAVRLSFLALNLIAQP